MKKKRFYDKKHFYITVDPFEVDVLFAINTTTQETMKFLKKSAVDCPSEKAFKGWDTNPNANGRMILFHGGFIVLLKAEKDKFRYFIGVLSHEVAHVVHYMLQDRRLKLNTRTEEMYTYHIQNLIYKALINLY